MCEGLHPGGEGLYPRGGVCERLHPRGYEGLYPRERVHEGLHPGGYEGLYSRGGVCVRGYIKGNTERLYPRGL